MTLVEFIEQRLSEDEAAARAADTGARWTPDVLCVVGNARNGYLVAEQVETEQATHIARHDPARVLREVAALRRVVAQCHRDRYSEEWGPDEVLRALASAWADHADYDEGWAV